MSWIVIVLGAAAAFAALVYRAYRWWQTEFLKDLDLSDVFADLEKTWTPEPFPNSGRLPMSTRLQGTFLRWHNPAYYFTGAGFWKTFQDGPWKWADRQRYAGKGHNCGHYFALTETGARAEGGFYDMDFSRYRLLAVDFEADAILDLTYEANLVAVARRAIADLDKVSDRHFLVTILSFLIDASKGGTGFTDYLGHWASRDGYDGILFFGARAMNAVPHLKDYIENGADDGMAGPVVHGYFHEMRKNNDLKNVVIFSGARLTATVKTSRLLPEAPASNPYYGASAGEIDARLEFNAEYQAGEAAKGFYLAKPFTIE